MSKIKEYKGIILIILVILGLAFYWFEWRPSEIKKNCSEIARKWADIPTGDYKPDYVNRAKEWSAAYDPNYKSCLNENGI